ncbi:MAG: DUF2069 domain-containing protein [Halofilum sp. (in: g-proteobacteria)]
MARSVRICRALALTGHLLLLVLLLNWLTWLSPAERVPVSVMLLIVAAPLLLPLRGLLHGRIYTHAWASFLALPYFAFGVDAIAAGVRPEWLGWAAVIASLALFTGATGYTRLRGRELRAIAQEQGEPQQ